MNPPRKRAPPKRSRISKAEKYLIWARHEGISLFEELAAQYSEGRKTTQKPSEEQIRWRKAKRRHTLGVIGGTIANRESARLNVFKEVEHALKQLKPDQPTWKKRSKAWRLLYDYMLPHIRNDIHKLPRLREIINERMSLLETYEAYHAQQPVNVGETRKILARAAKEYLQNLRDTQKRKDISAEEKYKRREASRTEQERINHAHARLADYSPNQMIFPRKLDKMGMQYEWFRKALQFQLHSFETLVGKTEAKHIDGSEWVFRTWLRTQNGFRDGENDRQGRDEWENPR